MLLIQRSVAIIASLAAVFVFALVAPSFAAGANAKLENSRTAETEAMSLLSEYFRFEEALLSPDNDRLLVFVSVPNNARVIVEKATLFIDGKAATDHSYSASELLNFKQRSTQLLHVGRVAPGSHSLRLDVTAMRGAIVPMKEYEFMKGQNAKFVELQITGFEMQEVLVVEW